MIYNLTHIFTLWFGSDFVVIALILYAPCICAIDLRYNICKRFNTCINMDMNCVDMIFGHILIIALVILLLDFKYHFLHFMTIVDYADVRITILRIDTITTFIIMYHYCPVKLWSLAVTNGFLLFFDFSFTVTRWS